MSKLLIGVSIFLSMSILSFSSDCQAYDWRSAIEDINNADKDAADDPGKPGDKGSGKKGPPKEKEDSKKPSTSKESKKLNSN